MIGRILRPAPGKRDAIVLDHSGAVFRHGFVEDPVEWTLDPDRLMPRARPMPKRCEDVWRRACWNARNAAPSASVANRARACGFLPQRPPRPVPIGDGELAEVGRDRSTTPTRLRSSNTRAMARHAHRNRRTSAATNPVGQRSITRRNSATGRPTAPPSCRSRRRPRCARGCARG